jgi:archaellin
MDHFGRTGILIIVLLLVMVLVSLTTLSLVNTATDEITEDDVTALINDVVDDITSSLQIKDVLGKYNRINDTYVIQQLAILIQPLVPTEIDMTTVPLQLYSNEDVQFLFYPGNASDALGYHTLFNHPLWKKVTTAVYGILSLHDTDNSLVAHDVINDDMAYLLIKLPEPYQLEKGETVTLTLFPETGFQKTVTLKAPLPMKTIVQFE